ncbi:MAG: hypothetical protein H7Z41_06320 [Cytophagales bacterium]|nr:hypothetical protein [Armatimonadota bacterium]
MGITSPAIWEWEKGENGERAKRMSSTESEIIETDLPYITTFHGMVVVEAGSEGQARDRAAEWGVKYLTENTVVPEDQPVQPMPDGTPGQFIVPLAGTQSFIGPSQEAVNEKTARHIELARHTGPYLHIEMGEFFIRSGAPRPGADA